MGVPLVIILILVLRFHDINHPATKGFPHDSGNLQMSMLISGLGTGSTAHAFAATQNIMLARSKRPTLRKGGSGCILGQKIWKIWT